MTKKIYGRLLVIFFVLLTYQYYLLHHVPELKFYKMPYSHYQHLTEGFRTGHLSLPVLPSAELLQLADPYDPSQNADLRLHDASLYQGKYYLYFGPLPVLTFFMPWKLLTGFYPPDPLAILVFLFTGFVINFLLLIKIKETYFPRVSELQLLFMGLIMGFSNNAPFLFSRPKFYEVAISSAFCLMSLALFFLYQFFSRHLRSRDLLLSSLCLSLAVAGRPNFALVCLFFIPALFYYLCKNAPRDRLMTLIAALLTPAVCIGFLLGLYNYLRFDSFLEFGLKYQLSIMNMGKFWVFETKQILAHFLPNTFYYFFQPFTIHGYPLVHLARGSIYEFTSGILTTAPFVIAVAGLPWLLNFHFKHSAQKLRPLLWFTAFTFLVPIINIISLFLIPGIAQRYEMDFSPYLILLSIISLWFIEGYITDSRWLKTFNKSFALMGIASIFICMHLGM